MNTLIILAMVGGFLIIVGAGAGLLLSGGRQQVDERLEEFVGTTSFEVDQEIVDQAGPDMADRLDKALESQSFFDTIRERISRSDMQLRVSEYLILVVLSGLATAGLAYWFFDFNIVLAGVGFLVGLRFPRMYLGYAANKRIKAYNNQLGDTLDLWVNALRSGYSVLQAMEAIATELPPPISAEFERVIQEIRLGLPVDEALDNMYRRVPSEDLDMVITAVNIQREVGGNLAEVLDAISFTIRERIRIKGEVKTLTAQGRISGWVITGLPVALAFLLYAINPGYVSQLWVQERPFLLPPDTFPCGWIVIGIAATMIGIGGYAISRIVDIEV